MRALLPLGSELVLNCADCGQPSTATLAGSAGWTLRRASAQRLLDICPACSPAGRRASLAARRRGITRNGRGA